MHGSDSPAALFIIAKRRSAGPQLVSATGPGFLEAKKAALASDDAGPCPSEAPPDLEKESDPDEESAPASELAHGDLVPELERISGELQSLLESAKQNA